MAQAGPSEAPRRDESLGGQRAGWRRPRFPSSPSKCVVGVNLAKGERNRGGGDRVSQGTGGGWGPFLTTYYVVVAWEKFTRCNLCSGDFKFMYMIHRVQHQTHGGFVSWGL